MISILMPLYNGVEFLHNSISSVINQTNKHWELLIGVNGHEDNEYDNISRLINKYSDVRIKSIKYNFRSKTRTLNELTKYAQYTNICLLDVDDVWLPQKLEKQLNFTNYDVVGTNCEYFGDKTGTPGLFLGRLTTAMFGYQNPVVNSSVMIKKIDAWWDEVWEGLDDYNLWIHLLKNNRTFYNVPEILTRHRVHSNSYYNINQSIQKKMVGEIPKLTDKDYEELGNIMDNKKWEK